jgi:hypothetical protein
MEWNEELLGVRPVEGQNGSYGNRETYLAPCNCPCGQPTSFYVNPQEDEEHGICWEQTEFLRAESARAFIESLMAEDDDEEGDDEDGFSLLDLLFGSGAAGMSVIEPTAEGLKVTTIAIRPLGRMSFGDLFADEEDPDGDDLS